ncbi:MAG TPA: LysR family transcriptional regulator [Kofleriaceae bacterium]|nr:LysR family transcriptional regulator [Kofleriaceae bacterium]
MDYNDLALFTRVVERGSFTAAAQAAGLPKSSVTRSIARLERALGVRLIQRTTRQRGVTDAGRELYERVRGAVAAIEEASEAIREQGHEPRGVVRISALPDVDLMGVPELLAQLHGKLPSIHVELSLSGRIIDLVADGFDLAIRAGRLGDSSLIAKKVGNTHTALYAAKAYLKKRGKPKALADLKAHDCVLFRGKNGRARWAFEGDGEVEIDGVLGTDDFGFLARALEAGMGIGPLPMFMADRLELERVLPDHTMAGGPVHVVMPSASYVPARVTAVRDALVAHLQQVLAG